MQQETLRAWLAQRHVTIPQLFFSHYKALKITDNEAVIIMHLLAFYEEGNAFPTPQDLADRVSYGTNDVATILQRLMQKGFLEITQTTEADGVLYEQYTLFPLWESLMLRLTIDEQKSIEVKEQQEEGEIFTLFETEFGRLFSPMELEMIGMWLDVEHYSPTLIKAALKEAVISDKLNLRYIDRILSEWSRKNITTAKQAQQEGAKFRAQNGAAYDEEEAPAPPIAFYNWLEERE